MARKKAPPRAKPGAIRRKVGTTQQKVVKRRKLRGVLYQLEWITCGTLTCRCMREEGPQHGPYWYAYRVGSAGRWVSEYVGKKFHEVKA